jgi:glycosyltransferase involved in cell wall biosynthesis
LIHALGQLTDGSERYMIAVDSEEQAALLRPLLGQNQECVIPQKAPLFRRVSARLGRDFKRVLRRFSRPFRAVPRTLAPCVSISNGFFESLECAVIHFPHQGFVVCAMPSIYNPHDLQHLHFPEFFTAPELAMRETMYRTGCNHAHTIVAASQWVKDDLVSRYALASDRVQVIPWAPPLQAAPAVVSTVSHVKQRYGLPERFAFYPAMPWPHKNHKRLFEAIAMLRDQRGFRLHLVCTGTQLEPHWSKLLAMIEDLDLSPQISALGFVNESDLRAIYRLSEFLVLPTLFESDSSPIYEAWFEGVPVACANVTSLPAQVLDAALLFNPYKVEDIASAMERMSADQALRGDLQRKGTKRLADFSWERTAKAYRALYRKAARCPLHDEDQRLLSWDWMLTPNSCNRSHERHE